jgi:hypothetical protein
MGHRNPASCEVFVTIGDTLPSINCYNQTIHSNNQLHGALPRFDGPREHQPPSFDQGGATSCTRGPHHISPTAHHLQHSIKVLSAAVKSRAMRVVGVGRASVAVSAIRGQRRITWEYELAVGRCRASNHRRAAEGGHVDLPQGVEYPGARVGAEGGRIGSPLWGCGRLPRGLR